MPYYSDEYLNKQRYFTECMEKSLRPVSMRFDEQQAIPRDFFNTLADQGFLGGIIPKQFGGQAWDELSLGLLHEAVSKELSSLANILTVSGMVTKSILRFGSNAQKQAYLPRIASAEILVAFALTEPNIGSDLEHVETQLLDSGDEYKLKGSKQYITLGQLADLFLVLAQYQGKPTAILIEKNTPGLTVSPVNDLLGLRSNMLAEITFDDCPISTTQLLGSIGTGLTHVVQTGLDLGRYTTAWDCVGLGQACLEACRNYTHKRNQFERPLDEHQLVQKMMTEMIVQVKAARELCFYAGELRLHQNPAYLAETLVAKYMASKMAVFVSNHTVQIFGAAGYTESSPVARYYRDAKAMEIVEGTSQMHELLIPKLCLN